MTSLLAVDIRHQAGSLALQARFEIAASRTALFGPSGVGKSTLLRILAGLISPNAGSISLEGRPLLDTFNKVNIPAGQRQIGLLTQSGALFPHLSVEANVRFGLHSLSQQEQSRRSEEVLELAGLNKLRSRLPARLSGGERQRAALARALVPLPRLLLLDEPFSALDAAHKAELWAALDLYLTRHQIATLLVSHDTGEVWASAESVVRMENGIATETGPPAIMLRQEREAILQQLAERPLQR